MRAGAFFALVFLSACAFGSDTALFNSSDAARPFANDARFIWDESDDSAQRFPVVFTLEADGRYTLNSPSNDEPMHGLLFVAVNDTPEEDYVAQFRPRSDEPAVLFAFLWRTSAGYRVVVDPGRLTADDNLSAGDAYCEWGSMQSCGLSRREDVLGIYRALVYPRFVVGGEAPESYLDLLSESTSAPAPAKRDK